MKFFNAIAAAAVIGGSFIAPNQAEAYSCSPFAAADILERMLASGATFDMAIEQAWNRGHVRDKGCMLETMGVMKQFPSSYPYMHKTMRSRRP
jgi:hypothetical protein